MEGRDVFDEDEVSLVPDGVLKSRGSLMGYNCSPSDWLIEDNAAQNSSSVDMFEERDERMIKKGKLGSGGTKLSEEVEMMKERFAKLMLGEDMSGSGNGVCSALALSNSITNLCATIFGQLWRLEPLHPEKKLMWRREMDWLLSVSDHIVEMVPSSQILSSGSIMEVMNSRPRADLLINLPALRKLDNMLLEILDSFCDTEFWYVDQRIVRQDSNFSAGLPQLIRRQDEKWWLPMPQVPSDGLSKISRKNLIHKRECANQILKAAMSINNAALAEMDIPNSFWETLPKTGKETLGDFIHKCINSEQFSPEHLLDCLQLPSEHRALEIANRFETTLYIWRQRSQSKLINNSQKIAPKPRWNSIIELLKDGDKTDLLAERAESVLMCLKQRFPSLPQTTLDMSKIQYNQDVGKSILESYSRVLESIASNIVARIDDLLRVDSLFNQQHNLSAITSTNIVSHNRSVLISSSPSRSSTSYQTAYTSLSFSSPVSPSKSQVPNTIFPGGLPRKKFGHLMKLSPDRNTTANMNNWEELITSPARTFFRGRKGSRSDITMG